MVDLNTRHGLGSAGGHCEPPLIPSFVGECCIVGLGTTARGVPSHYCIILLLTRKSVADLGVTEGGLAKTLMRGRKSILLSGGVSEEKKM